MENILKNYFGCKNPFDEYGKITPEGEVAQEKLIQLLKDLALVIPDVISEDDARTAERMIDDICCENYDWETHALDLIHEHFPYDNSEMACDFMQNWSSAKSDEENIKEYERIYHSFPGNPGDWVYLLYEENSLGKFFKGNFDSYKSLITAVEVLAKKQFGEDFQQVVEDFTDGLCTEGYTVNYCAIKTRPNCFDTIKVK